jgi:tetraacyldisaccharide 4'-kinase
MDLALESDVEDDPWENMPRPHIMLLPGSRPRAYKDTAMLLDTVRLISERISCGFMMALAPTLDLNIMLAETRCGLNRNGRFEAGSTEIGIYTGPIAPLAYGADLLIGLGGTANQVAAGLGVPVLSIIERGKMVQKKLLGDSETLTHPMPSALAEAALEILGDPVRSNMMSRAGIKLMGGAGALDAVTEYAADELGWNARCKLFENLRDRWLGAESRSQTEQDETNLGEEPQTGWKMSQKITHKMLKVVKIIK